MDVQRHVALPSLHALGRASFKQFEGCGHHEVEDRPGQRGILRIDYQKDKERSRKESEEGGQNAEQEEEYKNSQRRKGTQKKEAVVIMRLWTGSATPFSG